MLSAALAELLSDPEKRAAFSADPESYVSRFTDLDPDEHRALLRIAPAALDRQAQLLVRKRAHEAAKVMPRTRAALGPDYLSRFTAHARTFWPEGPRRHAIDALAFLDSGMAGGSVDDLEREFLKFNLRPRAAIRVQTRILRNVFTPSGSRTGIAIFYSSRRGRTGFRFFYF